MKRPNQTVGARVSCVERGGTELRKNVRTSEVGPQPHPSATAPLFLHQPWDIGKLRLDDVVSS